MEITLSGTNTGTITVTSPSDITVFWAYCLARNVRNLDKYAEAIKVPRPALTAAKQGKGVTNHNAQLLYERLGLPQELTAWKDRKRRVWKMTINPDGKVTRVFHLQRKWGDPPSE